MMRSRVFLFYFLLSFALRFVQPFLKSTLALAQRFCQLRQPGGAKEQKNNYGNDQQFRSSQPGDCQK